MNTVVIENPIVLDAKGNPLVQGAIVQIINPSPDQGVSPFEKYRGVVLTPYEHLEEDPRYSVPVFFFQEVESHHFEPYNSAQRDRLSDWQEHQLRDGDPSFLFQGKTEKEEWKDYPRVRFFMPTDMIICEGFTPDDMIKRLFGTNYMRSFRLQAYVPKDPKACQCFIAGCQNPATNLTHYNEWGSIQPMYTCPTHHKQWNGVRTDGPTLKDGIYLIDGTCVQQPSQV